MRSKAIEELKAYLALLESELKTLGPTQVVSKQETVALMQCHLEGMISATRDALQILTRKPKR